MRVPTFLVGLMLASGLGSATAEAAETKPIRIGAFLPVTGPASYIGDPQKKALDMMVEHLNKDGGLLGRPVELITYDDGGAPDKAATYVKRLIQNDQVDALIGGVTATTMAAMPIAEAAGVPFVSLAGAVNVIDPVRKWVFKTPQTDRMAAEKVLFDMKARGITRMALLSEDSGFGKSGRQQTLEAAKAAGIEIVADETYGAKDTDVTAQLTKIRSNTAAQALFVFGFGPGPVVVTANVKQLGLTIPVYQSHGVASKEYIRLAGEAANGVRLPATGLMVAERLPEQAAQKRLAVAFTKEFQERFKSEPSSFVGYAYDALQIVVDAMRRAKSADRAAVRDEIEKTTNYVGLTGRFTMSPTDHMGLGIDSFHMVEIKRGDWLVLD